VLTGSSPPRSAVVPVRSWFGPGSAPGRSGCEARRVGVDTYRGLRVSGSSTKTTSARRHRGRLNSDEFDLTEVRWAVGEPLLPKGKKPGRPAKMYVIARYSCGWPQALLRHLPYAKIAI
jgi:hypothetical protein